MVRKSEREEKDSEGELVVALHSSGAPGGELAFELEGATALRRGNAKPGVLGSPTEFPQARGALGLPAAQPLADGFRGGGKGAGSGLDAVLLSEADHLQAEVVRVVALTHEVVIWDGAQGEMLAPGVVWANHSVPDPGVPESAVPPAGSSHHAQPPQGDTIYIPCPIQRAICP